MLVDHADPAAIAPAGRDNFHGLLSLKNFPCGGFIQAVQDVHEGGFAGAVFAQEAVNLTRFNHQVKCGRWLQGTKTFGDAPEFKFQAIHLVFRMFMRSCAQATVRRTASQSCRYGATVQRFACLALLRAGLRLNLDGAVDDALLDGVQLGLGVGVPSLPTTRLS